MKKGEPKNDTMKEPWAARKGDYTPIDPRKMTPERKKANDDFNAFFGLDKPKKPTKKTPKKK